MEDFKFNINGTLEINGVEIKLTPEQMTDLGLRDNPFDVRDGDEIYYIDEYGYVDYFMMDYDFDDEVELINTGKQCKSQNIMVQKKLRRDLNDLIFKFAVENDCLCSTVDAYDYKYSIIFNTKLRYFEVDNSVCSVHIDTIYFDNRDYCQRCLEEVVKPYWKKHKREWDWNYNY